MKNKPHILLVIFILLAVSLQVSAASINGFNLDDALIPVDEIHSGGPPKDGIPSLDNPIFIKVSQAHFLRDTDRVLALTRHGVSKAYPLRILNWHL